MDSRTDAERTTTIDDIKGAVESDGGVDLVELGEYAESCWTGC
ncbi:hypothetical protein [Saccharothrix algeriensis]|uniref:Uncharacterized protein n=1 Tax=Saccharothrix algeriensis TaxID=173560 RepID=A0ABS2S0N9_9PSEU|nr:hypothetical protein [Saccharothrix algeriensis]MBM7809799.1 hypothetical protein [Saccharothrix algeriensis]